jgi:hypothetical protein
MSSALVDFLATLATDSQLLDLFHKDPDGAMVKFGLSDQEKSLVQRKDVSGIKLAVHSALSSAAADLSVANSVPSEHSLRILIGDPPPMSSPVSHRVKVDFVTFVPLQADTHVQAAGTPEGMPAAREAAAPVQVRPPEAHVAPPTGQPKGGGQIPLPIPPEQPPSR